MGTRNRTTKAERRRARAAYPAECRRSGVGVTVRRIRDGWGPIRIQIRNPDGSKIPGVEAMTYFGKFEAVYGDRA